MNVFKIVISLILLTALTACGSDNKRPAVVDPQTEFKGFIEQQFAQTADTTDPLELDELEFRFPAQDDPAAFDSLL
jgi:hypothetical protein